jgi:hypothetical protein
MYERLREQMEMRQAEIARDARFAALRRDADLARLEHSNRRARHRIPAVHISWWIGMARAAPAKAAIRR